MNMTLKINGKQIAVVDVPDGFHSFRIIPDNMLEYLGGIGELKNQTLPEGQWSILGLAGSLTEEQARGLGFGVTEFGLPKYTTAIHGWQSYCKANGINENQLVLVKQ